jgi:hypothetical protein
LPRSSQCSGYAEAKADESICIDDDTIFTLIDILAGDVELQVHTKQVITTDDRGNDPDIP